VDLRYIHKDAVHEFVAAYQAQLKRPDFTDREKIDSVRLGVLNIALKAADFTSPVVKAVADIVHSVMSGAKAGEK
jgi:hypothetical protein